MKKKELKNPICYEYEYLGISYKIYIYEGEKEFHTFIDCPYIGTTKIVSIENKYKNMYLNKAREMLNEFLANNS